MTLAFAPLLAADAAREYFELGRMQALDQWWHWLLLAAVCALLLGVIIALYLRDSVELPWGLSLVLLTLRVLAFAGILFFFLDLEKRSVRTFVKNSRVLLLIDTSQSMGLRDDAAASTERRIDPLIQQFAGGDLIEKLRTKHDVAVYRFDQGAQPVEVAAYSKIETQADAAQSADSPAALAAALAAARSMAYVAAGFLAVSLITGLAYALVGARAPGGEPGSWPLLVSMVTLIVAVVVLAVSNLRYPQVGLLATIGLQPPSAAAPKAPADDDEQQEEAAAPQVVNWEQQLAPRGAETRLGDALKHLVSQERGGPIAGIAVFTDGRSNAGEQYASAVLAAQQARIPIHPIGIGSDRQPINVRIADLEAPERVYPGDRFSVTGYLQASALAGRTVTVELTSYPSDSPAESRSVVREDQRRVRLGADGEIQLIKFELTPAEQGRRTYKLEVTPPDGDQDPGDNAKTAAVEVVERKNRVLLLAGGPTREYRFLRNLLFRDRDTTLHVMLQSAQTGISQEADEILYEFPPTAEELFEYDCIVAFDPDWLALDEIQVDLLDRWVAEKAGGLIVVAGPVHTPQWANQRTFDTRLETIRDLYPVSFFRPRSATLTLGRFGGVDAWPLQFTRDGLEAEFLRLEDDAVNSEAAWTSFGGVYGYYAVKDAKKGAQVFARFSDPQTAIGDVLPIYMAGQFYGGGRVFFQASGEMWRIRAVDDAYFETYYTKLIRWASQGRLQQNSARGLLLVDKDRCLVGDMIAVRATLADEQFRPLQAEQAEATVTGPQGERTQLALRPVQDAARPGVFEGQFTAAREGDYRVELNVPRSDEVLARDVRARVPDLEIEQPQRNDPLLKDIAEKTGGEYYVGLPAALGTSGTAAALDGVLAPQDQTSLLSGAPDKEFDRLLMTWLMVFICGALCFEWLLRRLNKLA